MNRPNVIEAPRHNWDDFALAGLGFRFEDTGRGSGYGGGGDYGGRGGGGSHYNPPPKSKPVTCGSGYVLSAGKCVAVHTTAPPRHINPKARYPIVHWRPAPPPPPTCAPGTSWDGTTCIPSGSPCQPPNVLDAAGNCSLPGSGGTCPPGYVVDASGACTGDPRNPYSLYLPDPNAAAAAANAAAVLPTCASGQFDAQGNCIPLTIWQWLQASTIIPGVENMIPVGGGVLAALLLLHRKPVSGGRKR